MCCSSGSGSSRHFALTPSNLSCPQGLPLQLPGEISGFSSTFWPAATVWSRANSPHPGPHGGVGQALGAEVGPPMLRGQASQDKLEADIKPTSLLSFVAARRLRGQDGSWACATE